MSVHLLVGRRHPLTHPTAFLETETQDTGYGLLARNDKTTVLLHHNEQTCS